MSSIWKDFLQKLHCVKCSKFFINPKLLPCLHLVCAECLQEELSTSSSGEAAGSSLNNDRKRLQCPVCKEIVSIPLKVEDLITDMSTVHLVEMLNKKAEPRCQICATVVAHALCLQCRTLLCKECLSAHGRAISTKNHAKVLLLEDMRTFTGDLPIVPDSFKMCPTHSTKSLDLYCQQKTELACEQCISSKHTSHQYVKIDDTFVSNEKKILENMLPGVQQQIKELETAADEVERESVNVNKAKAENLRKLDEMFDSIQTTLNQRKKQLQNNISYDANQRDKSLQDQRNKLISLLHQLRRCNDFTDDKLQQGVKEDIVSMRATILERGAHLKAEKSKVIVKPSAEQQTEINFYSLADIKNSLLQLGTFVSPINCAVRNLKQKIPVNTPSTFSVLLKDTNERALSGISDQLHVKIQYYNMARSTTTTDEVKELRDGCYEVSYTPKIGGDHTVSVQAGGVPLLGSPF